MVPVEALPLQLAQAFLVASVPDAAAVPVALSANQLSESAIVNALHKLYAAELVPALSTANDCQALLFGDFGGRHNLTTAGHVRSDGLLGKDVLACLDSGHHLPPAKRRRRRHTQQVCFASGQLLVAVEAPEKMVVVNLHATFEFVVPQEPVSGFPDLTLEQVSQGDDLHAGIGLQALTHGTIAAPAAPEQSHFDLA